jgi:ABC-type nitrate/sulfonate/bicarbonate transport system substrate-binding protein
MPAASDPRRSRWRKGLLLALPVLVSLSLTACGGDDDESGKGTDGAAASGGSTEPEGPVDFAFSSLPQVEKIPTLMAIEALDDAGYETSSTFLSTSEDPVAAVVRGDANFGSAASSAVFTAISEGAPIVAVMQAMSPNYALVAPTDVDDPGGLDGLRVGIHAAVSSTMLYTELALADYPDAEPEILIVPGSAKRIEALAAGELDASVIQLTDIPRLEELAPGKFHVIHNFAEENSDLVDTVIFVSRDTLDDNAALVESVIAQLLQTYGEVYDDVDGLAAKTADEVADIDEATAKELAEIYVDAHVWPEDGGLSEDAVEGTLEALESNGLIEKAPAPADVYDRGPLDAALARG